MEVIFIVVGGCLSQLEVVCNKGRYRAARAAKNKTQDKWQSLKLKGEKNGQKADIVCTGVEGGLPQVFN